MKTLATLALLGVVACGGSTTTINTDDGGADSATDAGGGGDSGTTCPGTSLGKSIYGSCFDAITLTHNQGGFGPPVPQGSECTIVGDVYDLDLKSGAFKRESCVNPGYPQPYKKTTVTATFAPGALAGVVSALKSVVVTSNGGCVADGPTLMLDVKASGKSVRFGDSKLSACMGTPVDGLDGLETALQAK